jgi:hypothetical protein
MIFYASIKEIRNTLVLISFYKIRDRVDLKLTDIRKHFFRNDLSVIDLRLSRNFNAFINQMSEKY